MPSIETIAAKIGITPEEPDLQRAQLRSLARQLPLIYTILVGNALAVASLNVGASTILLLSMPGAVIAVGLLRVPQWRRLDTTRLDDAGVRRKLRVAMILVLLLSAAFTLWLLALMTQSGNEEKRVDLVFFAGITTSATMFCLMQMRYAAPLIVTVMVLPTVGTLMVGGGTLSAITAADLLLVSAVMMVNATSSYRDFRRLNTSLIEVAALSSANERASRIDSLTGIGNRRCFFVVLDAAVADHPGRCGGFLVGLIDLDGFKPVNDLNGHAAGDALLAVVARRMRDALPPAASCARIGGDEFAFLVPGLAAPGSALALGRRICATIAEPIDLSAAQVRVEATVGLALFPSMGSTREQILEHADFALYHGKTRSRGRAVLFSLEHAEKIRAERRLQHALRWADLDEELSLVFQPIVDVVANRVTAFEALARWHSPTLGRVSPAVFMPVAERSGLVEAMTAVLFRKACAAARAWPDTIALSFNLSGEDLVGSDAVDRLKRMVLAAGLRPDRLIFEVTETALVQDFASASATLQALRDLGCRIALDDFGIGFSSLSYVHRLPLDKLKIDGSFVRALASDTASRSIVQSIIDLTAKLDIACVVEGVETQDQADMLRAMGCEAMQGWLFGTPIAESALARGDFPLAAYARATVPDESKMWS